MGGGEGGGGGGGGGSEQRLNYTIAVLLTSDVRRNNGEMKIFGALNDNVMC